MLSFVYSLARLLIVLEPGNTLQINNTSVEMPLAIIVYALIADFI